MYNSGMVTRRTTFRLYPNRQQESILFRWRRLHAYLYNSALADRRDSYQRRGERVSYFDQQNRLPAFKEVWPEYKELGCDKSLLARTHALQATLKRVDYAYQRFFKGVGAIPSASHNQRSTRGSDTTLAGHTHARQGGRLTPQASMDP